MNKLLLLVGAGVGYVLGARAGRERYDKIADQANKLWNDPRVQTKVEEAKAKAPEVAHQLGDQAKAKAGEVKAKVSGSEGTGSGSTFSTSGTGSSGTGSFGTESSGTGGTYSNETGSIDPVSGPQVDSSSFGPGGDKLP